MLSYLKHLNYVLVVLYGSLICCQCTSTTNAPTTIAVSPVVPGFAFLCSIIVVIELSNFLDLHLATSDSGYMTVIEGFAAELQCTLNTCIRDSSKVRISNKYSLILRHLQKFLSTSKGNTHIFRCIGSRTVCSFLMVPNCKHHRASTEIRFIYSISLHLIRIKVKPTFFLDVSF